MGEGGRVGDGISVGGTGGGVKGDTIVGGEAGNVGVMGDESVGVSVPSQPMTMAITMTTTHSTRRRRWNLSRAGEFIQHVSPFHTQTHHGHTVLR